MRIKGLIENLYKKNKSIAIGLTSLLILIVFESTGTFFVQHIKTIDHLKEGVSNNEQKIEDAEKERDDDYNRQDNFNDEITSKVGLLEGRLSVIEQLFYDINRSRLKK